MGSSEIMLVLQLQALEARGFLSLQGCIHGDAVLIRHGTWAHQHDLMAALASSLAAEASRSGSMSHTC